MDDLDRQFPYPRFLRVPFIFIPKGTPEGPEGAAFKAAHPGWVKFPATFVPRPQPALEAEAQPEPAVSEQPQAEPWSLETPGPDARPWPGHLRQIPRPTSSNSGNRLAGPPPPFFGPSAGAIPAAGPASHADSAGKGTRLAQAVDGEMPVEPPVKAVEGEGANPGPGSLPEVVAPETASTPAPKPPSEVAPVPQPAAPIEAAPEKVRARGDVKGGLPAPEAAPSDPSAASVLDKLNRYTLNSEHSRGKEKAAWFEKALGYTRRNINGLAKQLVFDNSKAVQTEVTPYGTIFRQIIDVAGANGRTIPVVTVWIRGQNGITKLVTALPGK